MALLRKGPFGHTLFIKRWFIRVFRLITYSRYDSFNQLKTEGSDVIRSLPLQSVLFIPNRQTYFAGVTTMYHVFNASLKGRKDTLDNMGYLWNLKLNIYYVVTSETMKSGILPKILGCAGVIPVNGMWHERGKEIHQEVRQSDVESIGVALASSWVIASPQGTTSPWKPTRKDTIHFIEQYKLIVVPIVIDGFRRSLGKKGINIKKRGVRQSMVIKLPLRIDYENDTVEQTVTQIKMAIEQRESSLKARKLEFDNAP